MGVLVCLSGLYVVQYQYIWTPEAFPVVHSGWAGTGPNIISCKSINYKLPGTNYRMIFVLIVISINYTYQNEIIFKDVYSRHVKHN